MELIPVSLLLQISAGLKCIFVMAQNIIILTWGDCGAAAHSTQPKVISATVNSKPERSETST